MKNNKGQVLITFVLMIPLIFILMAIIIDYGIIALKKREVNNVLNNAVEYAKENKYEEELVSKIEFIINNDLEKINSLEIDLEKNKTIHIVLEVNGIFKNILDKDIYKIDITKEIKDE